MMATLRGFADVLRGSDITSATVAFQQVIQQAIVRHCDEQDKRVCDVPITKSQLTRGFKVLAALATYGSSYRKMNGEQATAEEEQLRADERRKAVESLIDAVTDRVDREGDFVVSLGANVALGLEGRSAQDRQDYINRMPLSLKTGVALQWLPDPLGWHAMISVLDLAQYATLSQDGTTKLKPEGALRVGLEGGALLGKPSFPVTLTAQVGYVPWVKYGENTRPEFTIGAGIGGSKFLSHAAGVAGLLCGMPALA
jgi:hypothetical protein